MQFQFAKWIVIKHLNVNAIDISFKLPHDHHRKAKLAFAWRLRLILINWLVKLCSRILTAIPWTILLVLIYILPLIIAVAIVYSEQLQPFFITPGWLILRSYYFWLSLSIIGMAFYTLASNWVLYVFYFEELAELSEGVRTKGIQGLWKGCKAIYFYFVG